MMENNIQQESAYIEAVSADMLRQSITGGR